MLRPPWSMGFALCSLWGALGYVWGNAVAVVIGVLLLLLNCYSWVLLVKPLQAVRPPAFVVRAGLVWFRLGLLVWAASALFEVEVTVPPRERWTLGDGV
ncbi:MAG: hypothetical protein ACYTFA_03580, partial [Planctomycetota bacterium]